MGDYKEDEENLDLLFSTQWLNLKLEKYARLLSEKDKQKIKAKFIPDATKYIFVYQPEYKERTMMNIVLLYEISKALRFNQPFPSDLSSDGAHSVCRDIGVDEKDCDVNLYYKVLEKYYVNQISRNQRLQLPQVEVPEPLNIKELNAAGWNGIKRASPREVKSAIYLIFPPTVSTTSSTSREESKSSIGSSTGTSTSNGKKELDKCGYPVSKKISEGTFGKVYLTADGQHAVKIIKNGTNDIRGFDPEQLDEILYQSMMENRYNTPLEEVKFDCDTDGGINKDGTHRSENIALLLPAAVESLWDLKDNEHWDFSRSNPLVSVIKSLRFSFAHDMACGVNYMHKHGLMMLDLKPQNTLIFVDPSAPFGVLAKLADYGLTQLIKGGRRSLGPNEVVTLNYRDPRLACEVDGQYDESADMWSLGIILMYIFFGFMLPYWTKDQSTESLSQSQLAAQMILQQVQPTRVIPGSGSGYDDEGNISSSSSSTSSLSNDFLTKLEKGFGNSEARSWCKAILTDNKSKSIQLPTSFESLLPNRGFFKYIYYGREEYKNIWQVIDACLRFNVHDAESSSSSSSSSSASGERPTAEEVLRMPLFNEDKYNEDKCFYPLMKEVDMGPFPSSYAKQLDKVTDVENDDEKKVLNATSFIMDQLVKKSMMDVPYSANLSLDDAELLSYSLKDPNLLYAAYNIALDFYGYEPLEYRRDPKVARMQNFIFKVLGLKMMRPYYK